MGHRRMSEGGPRQNREEKDGLIRDVEESLEESSRERGGQQGEVSQRLKNHRLTPVAALLALGISAICLTLGVFCLVYLLFALVG